MSYYVPSSTCDGVSQPDYSCTPCITTEHGRIRKLAIIKVSYVATVMAAPENDSTWTTGLSTGNLFILSQLQGSYDGGSTTELTGFGDQATTNGNTTHTLTFKDPNYSENCDFYNAIRNSSDYTIAYVTENFVHFAEEAVTFTPKNPVQDDINSIVTWEVQCKWTNPDSPCPYTKPTTAFESCVVHS